MRISDLESMAERTQKAIQAEGPDEQAMETLALALRNVIQSIVAKQNGYTFHPVERTNAKTGRPSRYEANRADMNYDIRVGHGGDRGRVIRSPIEGE